MSLDRVCLRLRDLCNRRLSRSDPTRVTCLSCNDSVAEWVTIRWQVTDREHWPSTDGKAIANLCLDCSVPHRVELGEAIEAAVTQVLLGQTKVHGSGAVSVNPINLDQPAQLLANYTHLERFGGRYRTVLAGTYRATRRMVVSILNDHGDIRDDRTDEQLFDAVAKYYPEYSARFQDLLALRAFTQLKTNELPFDPVGPDALPRVQQLLAQANEILNLAYVVRMNAL